MLPVLCMATVAERVSPPPICPQDELLLLLLRKLPVCCGSRVEKRNGLCVEPVGLIVIGWVVPVNCCGCCGCGALLTMPVNCCVTKGVGLLGAWRKMDVCSFSTLPKKSINWSLDLYCCETTGMVEEVSGCDGLCVGGSIKVNSSILDLQSLDCSLFDIRCAPVLSELPTCAGALVSDCVFASLRYSSRAFAKDNGAYGK